MSPAWSLSDGSVPISAPPRLMRSMLIGWALAPSISATLRPAAASMR